MRRPRRTALVVCLVLLVGVAGCLSGSPTSDGPATSPPPSPGTPSDRTTTAPGFREATDTPEPLAGRAECPDDLWVSFWGLNEPRLWEPNQVRFGTDVPPNGTYLYVAYVDGSVRGVRPLSGGENGVHVDGGSVPVEGEFRGEHRVRIVAHRDADHDEEFDPGTDPPCQSGDGLVQTEYLVVDFDRYW